MPFEPIPPELRDARRNISTAGARRDTARRELRLIREAVGSGQRLRGQHVGEEDLLHAETVLEEAEAEYGRAAAALRAWEAAHPRPESEFVRLFKQHLVQRGCAGLPTSAPKPAPAPAPAPAAAPRPAGMSPFGWRPSNRRAAAERREAEILASLAALEAIGAEAA